MDSDTFYSYSAWSLFGFVFGYAACKVEHKLYELRHHVK